MNRAASGLQNPGDRVQQRGLSGAVRTDQSHDLVLTDVDADLVEGTDTSERQRDVARDQGGLDQSLRWLRRLAGRETLEHPFPALLGGAGHAGRMEQDDGDEAD